MKKFFNIFHTIELIFCSVAMSIMVILTAGNVIARRFFNSSWSFTEELTCALFISITMLGAAMLCRSNGHISLDIITNLLPKSLHKIFVGISVLVAVAISLVLIIYGIEMVMSEIRTGQTTPALHIKEWIYGLTIPVGGVCIFLHVLEWGVQELARKEEK